MKLGSGEHYGWEEPRPVELRGVYAGPQEPDEFAWLSVPEGVPGGPLDVVVRPRTPPYRWRAPSAGQRVQVAAWVLDDAGCDALAGADRWELPKPLPDLWLWVSEDGS